MFGNKTRIYNVYVKKGAASPLHTAEFIKDGFNIWAFFFDIFWFSYKKVWFVALAILGIYFLNYLLLHKSLITLIQLNIFRLGMKLWLGFEANELKGKQLIKKGYFLIDVVTARDSLEAQKRFYDKYAFATSQSAAYQQTPAEAGIAKPSIFASRTVKPII